MKEYFLCTSINHLLKNQQGKLIERFIYRKPHLGITVTKDILAARKDNSRQVDSKEPEEGDAHIGKSEGTCHKFSMMLISKEKCVTKPAVIVFE